MFAQHPVDPYNIARNLPPPEDALFDPAAVPLMVPPDLGGGGGQQGGDGQQADNPDPNDEIEQERRINAARGLLMTYFTDEKKTPGFQFRRFLGQGGYGIAALVADVRNKELPPRLLVVKRGFGGEAVEKSMGREIDCLQCIRGGMHFAQILAFRQRFSTKPIWEIRDLFRNRGRYLNGLPGPTIVTEYVENGTFEDFFDKTREWQEPVPNRILWNILLCGIRACIGMMWPIMAEHKAPTQIETIGPNRPPLMLQHSDIHMKNVVFGELQHGSEEHDLVPAYKLIDFGVARNVAEDNFPPLQPEKGPFWNGRDVAGLVMALIAKVYNWEPRWGAFLDGYIQTDAWDLYIPGAELRYPWLDPDLRELIGRMMAKDEPNRIPIRDCLAMATAAVRDKTADDYPNRREAETDDAILAYIQRAFHDAEQNPAQAPWFVPDARRPAPRPSAAGAVSAAAAGGR
ncbi:uncharacterized protein PG986_010745 [Apiospora aurea]|uniref:Protein kinase domain-containing protein n=1 Tax=Apiospora aurea TaxID=335848 RepID=A0ABR1Q365_9PEZI